MVPRREIGSSMITKAAISAATTHAEAGAGGGRSSGGTLRLVKTLLLCGHLRGGTQWRVHRRQRTRLKILKHTSPSRNKSLKITFSPMMKKRTHSTPGSRTNDSY